MKIRIGIRTTIAGMLLLLISVLPAEMIAQGNPTADLRTSVRNSGAKGDGRADDTSPINASLAAISAEGGTIVFPVGTYVISSTIAPSRKVKLVCEGATGLNSGVPGSCRIKKSASMSGNAIFLGPATAGSIIEGLQVDGFAGNKGDGIQILTNSISLRDVAVVNQGGNGIRIGEDTVRNGTQANSFYLERVRSANNGGNGFYIHKEDATGPGWSDANAGTMINCVAQFNGGDGFLIGKGINNTFIGTLSESNNGAGVHLVAGSGNEVFVGGDLNEGNKGGNVVLAPGNPLGSYFFGTDTGTSVVDNGTHKSVLWNRSFGLTGTTPNPSLVLGQSVVMSGKGAPSESCRPGSLYLRSDGQPGTTLYVCEAGRWNPK